MTLMVSIAAVAAVAALSWTAWRRSRYRPAVLALESIRVALVALAALLLNQPETLQRFRPDERPQVVILADATHSMDTQDVVDGDSSGGNGPRTRRQAIAPLLVPEHWSGLLPDYEIVLSQFGTEQAAETDLHAALESVRNTHANLRAIVLLSDGDWNAGMPPVEAAARLRMDRVPVFAVPVGSQTRLPDLELIGFDVPAFGIVHKSVRLPFTIESSLPRDHAAVVRLTASDGTELEHPIQIKAMGRTSDAIVWQPESIGNFTLTIDLPPHPAERIVDNNRREAPIAIREERLKVLVVESLPRWEYRYLRNALSRDPGVEVRCLLFHPGLSKVGGGNRDYLPAFPDKREELAEYDVVFLGDVGIDQGQLTTDQCQLLRGLVEQQASGLVFMPGPQGKMLSLVESPLDPLLPVVLDASQPQGWGSRTPNHFALTQAGRRSLLTKLADTEEENIRVWENLPGFQWHAPVIRAKSGTDVLAVHQESANQYGRIPLLVTRTFGAGKILFMGTDGAWRWRRGVEDLYHYRFWGQVVRWMAYQRSMARGQRMRFYYSPEQPRAHHDVSLYANVMDASGEPLNQGRVSVRILAPDGRAETVHLEHVGDQWGLFTGRFTPHRGGPHEVVLSCQEIGERLESDLFVHGEQVERVGRPARYDVLEEIARVSGGRLLDLDDSQSIAAAVAGMPQPPTKMRRVQLWSHPAVALFLLLLLGIFWVGRKMVGLI